VRILFILVKYEDGASIITPFRAQQHANTIETTYSENSYNKMNPIIDITPVLTMPQPRSYYQGGPSLVKIRADAVLLAKQVGFNESDYEHDLIFSEKLWGGAKALGGQNVRTSWLSLLDPTAHELGHTMTWRHSNAWVVTGNNPVDPNGSVLEYGDKFDIMGDGPNFHHFNAWFKYRVGWIPNANIKTVSDNGTFSIQGLEGAPQQGTVTDYSSLRIPIDAYTEYWVTYKPNEPYANTGVLIHKIFTNNYYGSRLIDMTPNSQPNDWRDAALTPGETLSDPANGISIRLNSKTNTTANVTVTYAARTLTKLPIINIVSPKKGQTLFDSITFQITAYDPDIGNTNGAGITKVKFYLHPGSDPLDWALRAGLPPPSPLAYTELSSLPFDWSIDTKSLPQDGAMALVATAFGDQDSQTVRFNFLVDNTGPSIPGGNNNPPIINSYTPNQDTVWVQVGNQVILSVIASDPDSGTTLNYSWRINSNINVEKRSFLNVTPALESIGTHSVQVTVSDGINAVQQSWVLIITEFPVKNSSSMVLRSKIGCFSQSLSFQHQYRI